MSLSRNPLNRRRFLCLLGLSAIAAPLLVTACTRAEAQLDDSFTPVEGEDQSDLLTIGLSLLGSFDPAKGQGQGSDQQSSPNRVVSPVGAAAAAGVIAEGATSKVTIDPKRLQPAWTMWRKWAGPPTNKPGDVPVISAAARLLADPKIPIKPEYSDTIAGWDVPVETGKVTKGNLDSWVRTNTGGLVKGSGLTVTPDMKLVLQNAIIFAAKWLVPFKANDTIKYDFTKADGTVTEVDMMWLFQHHGPYIVSDGWQGVRLDYTDKELSAFVLIPDDDLGEVTPTKLRQALSRLVTAQEQTAILKVGLPKFKLTTSKDLKGFFNHVGLGEKVKLTKMTDLPTKIIQAVQQAFIIVDEEGTVAGAVTEVGMEAMSAPMTGNVTIIADRPFYFIVGDAKTATPLFLSYVGDPTKG